MKVELPPMGELCVQVACSLPITRYGPDLRTDDLPALVSQGLRVIECATKVVIVRPSERCNQAREAQEAGNCIEKTRQTVNRHDDKQTHSHLARWDTPLRIHNHLVAPCSCHHDLDIPGAYRYQDIGGPASPYLETRTREELRERGGIATPLIL